MIKAVLKKSFTVFMDFLQTTTKVLPTNIISPLLSANIYARSCFHSCQKQKCESFPYIMVNFSEL